MTSLPDDFARHFPQFEILECLGRGGMGLVYKARQTLLGRLVALKILDPARARDPQFAERFQREAQALARLNHPAIVTVHEFGETHGLFFLVMEYVDGASLRDVLRQGRVPPQLALSIVPKICEALQFAHEQGVVHRDIKPENLLLDRQGRVKIADFGIAKLFGEPTAAPPLTEARAIVGTPHYMAPEQVEHPQSVDHRADIYSLGVVFYELLTGELPLGRFSPPSLKARVDHRLDPVVLRALEKEPTQRYQQAADVRTDIEFISATPDSPPGPTPNPSAASRRNTATSDRTSPSNDDPTSALRLLSLGLGAVGVLNIAAVLGALLFAVALVLCDRLGIDLDGPLPEIAEWLQDPTPSDWRWTLATTGFFLLAGGGLTVLGASRLRRLRSYRLALMACVIAMVLPPALLLGLPLGIWGLVLLGRRNVQARFTAAHESQVTERPSQCGAEDERTRFRNDNLRSAAWVILVPLALMFLTTQWLKSEGPSATRRRAILLEEQLNREQVAIAIAASAVDRNREGKTTATVRTLESSPPVVIQTLPVAGADQVSATLSELRVTFSKDMKDNHWTWAEWKPGSLPETTGPAKFLEDGRTWTLPVRLVPGRAYAIWINSEEKRGFRDLRDQPSLPYLLHFQVVSTQEVSP
ncbi:MAG: protein kinase [Verrucomicrobiales bacterium]|nr:protein kinase [Verrucomicrobiales bacterium]